MNRLKFYNLVLELFIISICFGPTLCVAADVALSNSPSLSITPSSSSTLPTGEIKDSGGASHGWTVALFTSISMALYFVWNKYIRALVVIHTDTFEDVIQRKIKEKFGEGTGKEARRIMESVETILLEAIDTIITRKLGSRQLSQAIIQKHLIYDILKKCKESELADQHDAGIILMNELEIKLAKIPGLLTPVQALEILEKIEEHDKAENKEMLLQAIRILREKIDGLSIRVQ